MPSGLWVWIRDPDQLIKSKEAVLSAKLHYHLIGIGGAGMSAIAHILHGRGESVSGSDRQENDATRRLRAAGVKVSIGHSAANVNGADVVVYSAAIKPDNPERVEAVRKGIPTLERPAMLGRLMEPYQHRVAVSGTHGKTTTTSMIDMILEQAGIDASVLIGGDLKSLGGNARLGNGSVFVTEACEAFSSFLHLYPSITVITNIDADHLDHYGTIEAIENTFRKFVSQLDADGCVIACGDDPRVRKVLDGCGRRVIWFGLDGNSDLRAVDVDITKPEPTYTLVRNGEALGEVTLGVPGIQNVTDSLAAAGVAFELGADFEAVCKGLEEFHGAGRRFEVLYDAGGPMVVDDYAHHPAEIKATLSGTRAAYGDRHIIAVFQPHLYSRTRAFRNEFAEALSIADEVVVSSIYAARELPIEGVTAESIVDKMRENGFQSVQYAPDKDVIPEQLAREVKSSDLVIILGAGDIRIVGERLAAILSERGNG
ncbi:MAG: UDP-N-acetylmuramate--L-alanine ligase [Armatimonadota bacterium]|nr:UDP-N-acetylmuramate--L-alanine ligase [bacterium]